ncbi:hypothetical protein FGO68_gene6745 [Halteria grandinella]|uniref:Uncharacterized protein n=1 Tax=Halteria grandinella TaxID=5974 RepID=A0A8J8SWG9_HALGN|nr:hypothetical protein FGO68_gene6745 [Halteria grandinella]
MKWNANVSPHTFRHETSMRLYGQLYGESKVAQDIPFPGSKLESVIATAGPRGLDEQFVASAKRAAIQAQSGNTEKHMNREFFTGHKLPIVYICFVENSPGKIITIDDNGHIFQWQYTAEHVTSKQRFEPSHKFRLDLKYPKYTRLKENRLFPPVSLSKNDLDPSKALSSTNQQACQQYMDSTPHPLGAPSLKCDLVNKKALDRYTHPKTGAKTLIMPVGRAAANAQEREFEELTYNGGGMLVKRAEVVFKIEWVKSRISKAKPAQSKKFTVLEILKDQHMYGMSELKTVEYVFFKNEECCLHRGKAVLHLDKALPHDFDITNEVDGLDFAFLCVLSGSWIYIVSLLTSMVVKALDFSQLLAQQMPKQKPIAFDRLTLAHYKELYLSTSLGFDGAFVLKLEGQQSGDVEAQRVYSRAIQDLWSVAKK